MINPSMFINQFVWLQKFIPADFLFIIAFLACVIPGCFGVAWFFGYGRKWRHRRWSSEQSLRDDKRYAEYFKGVPR